VLIGTATVLLAGPSVSAVLLPPSHNSI